MSNTDVLYTCTLICPSLWSQLFVSSLCQSDPLQKAMNAFAEELSVPIAKLKFVFDGEQVEPSNTPQDLDMESDDVMDAQTMP